MPWKGLGNHSNALKNPWILLFSVGFDTLNQYKIFVVFLFGAAYAVPNTGTTINTNFLVLIPPYLGLAFLK